VKNARKTENLKSIIKNKLEEDKKYFTLLSEKLKLLKVGEKEDLSYQLQLNKMALSTQYALELLEKSFDEIITGKLPEGYSITPPLINVVGDTKHIFASKRGRALKLLLVRTAMELANASSISGLEKVLGSDPKESPFIQYMRLPSPFTYEGLENSPYFIKGNKSNFMANITNGYEFGGHRGEEQKVFAPKDCSDFSAKYINCRQPSATIHQVISYQLKLGFLFPELEDVVKKWEEKKVEYEKDDFVTAFGESVTPVKICDVQKITPGMLHVESRYTGVNKNHDVALWNGTGGHASFVIGTQGQGEDVKLWTIGANRDLEGSGNDFIFGVEKRTLFAEPMKDEKVVMYFDVNQK
jgi:hypothetical protein